MRAVCPTDSGPDIFVEFPAGSSDADLWRYGCRRADANDQPTEQDFVATGVVNLDAPTATEPSGPPRFAEPSPPSFVIDAVATMGPVVTAPRPTPRTAEPNPPTWYADLGNVLATVTAAVVDVVRPTPRIPPAPVVLDIPRPVQPFGDSGITQTPLDSRPVQPFGDSGITQTPLDFVPSIFTAPSIVTPAPAPRMADPNPPSWIADLVSAIAAPFVDTGITQTPREVVAPAPVVNRPRPASVGPVCLRLPGGGFTSVPPQYRNGYDGVEVDYAYCLGKTDTEPVILGPGGGSNPIEIPPTDPTPPPDPITQIIETFIPTGIVQLFNPPARIDPFRPDQLMPAKYQDTIFNTNAINTTPPAGDVLVDKPLVTATTSAPCSCHDDPAGENRNWMLLLAGALLVYLINNSKK